jgi:hypothetical protein
MSDLLLFDVKVSNFSANELHFDEMMMILISLFIRPTILA